MDWHEYETLPPPNELRNHSSAGKHRRNEWLNNLKEAK
jgi:hypothetical protein